MIAKNIDLNVGEYTEKEIIQVLSNNITIQGKSLKQGIGDDCAVHHLDVAKSDQVYTSDATIENIHFNITDDPKLIGHKAIGRVLSDLASMGAEPILFLVNAVIPRSYSIKNLEGIYNGMNHLLKNYSANLVGGDLSSGNHLSLHVFGMGILPIGSSLLRKGAKLNDVILTTGSLGNSQKSKHLCFTPRVTEGKWLRETGLVNSMIDVSDGLATDLRHLIETDNLGALLFSEQLELMSSINQVLYDGEDFELLFTVDKDKLSILENNWKNFFSTRLWHIGEIIDKPNEIYVRFEDSLLLVNGEGYQHF